MDKMPTVSAIAAIGCNGELGGDGDLLWHLPEDFKHFKEKTMGKPVIMGRATYESIGKALPSRLNIVLTRQGEYKAEGCVIAKSLDEAISLAEGYLQESDSKEQGDQEIFIIGGANVYKQALSAGVVSRLYLTLIDAEFPEADTFFPKYDEFDKVVEERDNEDKEAKLYYKFVILEKDKKTELKGVKM